MKKILAVSGPKGVGKTSLCKYLHYRYELVSGNIVDQNGNFIDKHTELVQYPETGRTNVYFEKDKIVKHASLHGAADSGIFSFANKVKSMSVDVMGLDSDCVYGSESSKNQSTRYMWDNLPIWVRWINSKDKSFLSVDSGDVVYIEGISDEISFFNICINRRLHPSNLRSGYMSHREVMQIIGTDIFRKMFDQNTWVNATMNEIEKSSYSLCLIDDMRFNSEARAVIERDGYIVILNAGGSRIDIHESEKGITEESILSHDHVYHIDPYEDIMQKNKKVCEIIDEIIFEKA
jgi:hypothetical protein